MNQSPHIIHQYDYRPKKIPSLTLFLIVFAGFGVLAFYALSLDGPIQNGRGFVLTKNQARLICGGFVLLSPIALYALGSHAIAAFIDRRKLILTPMQIRLPAPFRPGMKNQTFEIPLNSITSISIHDFVHKSKVIRLEYGGDYIANIHSRMLTNIEAFDEIYLAIQLAVKLAKPSCPTT